MLCHPFGTLVRYVGMGAGTGLAAPLHKEIFDGKESNF